MVPPKILLIPKIVKFFTAQQWLRPRGGRGGFDNHHGTAVICEALAPRYADLAGVGGRGSVHMKTLLGIAAVAAAYLFLAGPADAQGSCSGLCTEASSLCQGRVADLGALCRRQYGSVARYAAECQRREQ